MGLLTYELGACLEPSARARGGGGGRWPLGAWARCESALVHDAATGRWWAVGEVDELPSVEQLLGGAAAAEIQAPKFDGPLRSEMGRAAFERAVARAVEYIRAGDVFQVNLSHALVGKMRGTPRGLFASLLRTAAPWYGALLQLPEELGGDLGGCAVVSASPELFLEFDARTRRAVTRPMKGTRRRAPRRSCWPARRMPRNEHDRGLDAHDLGRVCEFGSLRVDRQREVEARPGREVGRMGGVWWGVGGACCRAWRRWAAHCARGWGSTTAPRHSRRARSPGRRRCGRWIIDESEARPRGPYRGCVGMCPIAAGADERGGSGLRC